MVTVRLTADAQMQIEELPRVVVQRIGKLVDRLEKWPEISGVKSLSGNLAGRYRLRTGDYRIQFRVEGQVIFVERIGHRDGFYE